MQNKAQNKKRKLITYPDNTRRWFDVVSTSFDRYGRQMNVETTLCAYWVLILKILFNKIFNKYFVINFDMVLFLNVYFHVWFI